jgi:hypothetical protein
MKRALQILAGLIAVAVVSVWFVKGASTRWWTQNRVQVMTPDPVTEIEAPVWQEKFLPGLDFLGGGLGLATALAFASRFIRANTNNKQTELK